MASSNLAVVPPSGTTYYESILSPAANKAERQIPGGMGTTTRDNSKPPGKQSVYHFTKQKKQMMSYII